MEVVEHVPTSACSLNRCRGDAKARRLMVILDLNRQRKSFALAHRRRGIVLRCLPRGTRPMGQIRHPRRLAHHLEQQLAIT